MNATYLAAHNVLKRAIGIDAKKASTEVKNYVDSGADRICLKENICIPNFAFAKYIDHTLLKPDASRDEIIALCLEAKENGFASVCVNPHFVKLSATMLKGTDVKVCTVVGFPLGATHSKVKAFETDLACNDGATEIDMVVNIGEIKSKNYDLVESDIQIVVETAKKHHALVKVIIETTLLTDQEKIIASILCKNAGADFVKTSTGFSKGGATVEDIKLMRMAVGEGFGIKASGGVRDYTTAKKMIEYGATRIGASASVKIVQEASCKTTPSETGSNY
ncbi:MAG: deoxyribose-phosphate aldolase [Chloroherpetonaceae bacterium]|nr:deoxyribose-phosphate aldolase [Chloroherpetonaceae bacterium]